ncbi:perlucin-like [Sitophilus oryzae]|uniref:Perlucin-like n=1 Tax=Sitophilus oryzae TaxID=7048 RepID=A0A6J2X752_SITOR|nr:perlucin-like [Sitophilus oryzae]
MQKYLIWLLIFVPLAATIKITDFKNSTKYHLSTIEATFPQALFTCKLYGWTLATEKTAQDTANLESFLTQSGQTSESIWLGGVYQVINELAAKWIWIESGLELSYTNWQSGEPAFSNSTTYSTCFKKNALSGTYSGQWYANTCETTSYYFVCEDY